jgi:anti-sigma factor RsiW
MRTSDRDRCEQSELTCAYALQVLPASEVAAAEAHIASCPECRRELASLRPVVDRFVSWPTDMLRPATSLQTRLAHRIAEETGKEPVPPPQQRWSEPEWEEVAPGIECKLRRRARLERDGLHLHSRHQHRGRSALIMANLTHIARFGSPEWGGFLKEARAVIEARRTSLW